MLAVLILTAGGCGGGAGSGSTLSWAVTDYEVARYQESLERASTVRDRGKGHERDQATYVAGLAAYRLGDTVAAARDLEQATRSSRPTLRARARASLGLVLIDLGRPSEAAKHLEAAAAELTGVDGRRAAFHAARAHRLAGDDEAADGWLRVASGDAGVNGGFTIQVGAFRDRRRAERAAADAEALARKLGVSPVEIVPRGDGRGRTLYVVRLGRFATRGDADNARGRLGDTHFITAAVPSPTS